MLATLVTAVVSGLRGALVRVEVDVSPGLPVCHIVGLPDAALSEARERVRSAIRNAGFVYPASRITVNLAPADRRKHGAAYDLAIAIGILVASDQLRPSGGAVALLGELSLDGTVAAGARACCRWSPRSPGRDTGVSSCRAPTRPRRRLVVGVEVVPLDGLDDAARLVAGPRGRRAQAAARRRPLVVSGTATGRAEPRPGDAQRHPAGDPTTLVAGLPPVDLAEVRGQAFARWALEVALAGGHDMLMIGPPGVGQDAPRAGDPRPAAATRGRRGAGGRRHRQRGRTPRVARRA